MENKKCWDCEKEYPATSENFYRNKNYPLGLSYRCKECAIKYKKNYYKNNKNKILEKNREYRKENKIEYTLKDQEKYRKNNPIKICSACNKNKHKSIKNFGKRKNRKDGLGVYCKECRMDIWRFRTYNITKKEYHDLLEKSNFSCNICGINRKNLKNDLHIDHDHKTGKIRGLLCYNCNRALGLFKDSRWVLNKGIQYLLDGEKL